MGIINPIKAYPKPLKNEYYAESHANKKVIYCVYMC